MDLVLFCIWVVAIVIGFAGGFLVLYSLIAESTGKKWEPLEDYATPVSTVLTILGTLLTAASIYLPTFDRPPWPFSKLFAAPAVILTCIGALIYFSKQRALPVVLVSGISLLAIAGGLLRLLPLKVETLMK